MVMAIERLGTVSFPSGRAVVIDAGMLRGDHAASWRRLGVIAADMPAGDHAVLGERVGDGDWAECWRAVWVDLGDGEGRDVARTEHLGAVPVDFARLMFIDADAIASWSDEGSLDGRADFVFWGRDAAALAEAIGAAELPGEGFGWADLPLEDAVRRGTEAERLKAERRWLLATDFRPHTHHFLVLAQARRSDTGSGELELAGARTCMFFTSWGDGVFDVWLDRDAAGRPLRLRVQLESDDSQSAMEAVNRPAHDDDDQADDDEDAD